MFYPYIMMATFRNDILQALQNYKVILRKQFPPEGAAAKIKKLNLKRKHLLYAADLELHTISLNVLNDIDQNLAWHEKSLEFKQYLQDILNSFIKKNNRVIHPQQKAAKALLEIVQLIRFPSTNNSISNKIDNCLRAINQYGTPEQKNQLRSILKKNNIVRSI